MFTPVWYITSTTLFISVLLSFLLRLHTEINDFDELFISIYNAENCPFHMISANSFWWHTRTNILFGNYFKPRTIIVSAYK